MPHKLDNLRNNYAKERTIESFYAGGPVALTKCGSHLFTNYDTNVKCVDLSNGKIKFTVRTPDDENEVTALALSHCDEFLVVAYRNTLIVQFRLSFTDNTVSVERKWKSGHRGPILCMDISEDSRLLATGSGDSTVKVWDLQAQYCIHTLKECLGSISCVQFAPSFFRSGGSHANPANETTPLLAYGDDTGKLFLRCLTPAADSSSSVWSLKQHTSAVTRIVFGSAAAASVLFACGRDAVVTQWDGARDFALKKVTPTFENLETMTSYDGVAMLEAKIDDKRSKEEQFLMTGGESGSLKIWSTKTGQCIKKVDVGSKAAIKQILQCEALRCYLVVTIDHVIISVSIDDLSILGRLIGRNDEIYDVVLCGPTLNKLAVAANSNEIRLYSLDTCQCNLLTNGHSDSVLALDSPAWDPCLLASCSKDNSVVIWRLLEDVVHSSPLLLATGHAGQVGAVRFSRLKPRPKGTRPFLASLSDDRTLKLWPFSPAPSDDDSPATKNLAAAATIVAHDKDASALDISPNDKFIATGSMDKTIKIWRIDDPKKLTLSMAATISGHKRGVFDVRFSPTDQVVASASGDFTIKIFALEDFSCVKTFEGHQATVLRVLFTSNGSQLLSTDSAGLLKLWTIKTNECVQTVDAHEDKIFALCSDPKSDRLITGGSDARLILWRDETEIKRSAEANQKRSKVEDEQRLANLMSRGEYSRALRLAIKLSRSFDAYKIVQKLIDLDSGIFDSLHDDQISVLLNYVIEWNSNSRDYLVGQKMLAAILKCRTPEQLLRMPNVEKFVEHLLPYSQRHFERLSRTKQQAYFVDYTWSCMKLTGNGDSDIMDEDRKIKREL